MDLRGGTQVFLHARSPQSYRLEDSRGYKKRICRNPLHRRQHSQQDIAEYEVVIMDIDAEDIGYIPKNYEVVERRRREDHTTTLIG